MSNELAVKQEQAVATWGGYGGVTGLENIDSSELKIPFINLLQSNSPLVEKDEIGKAGQFFDTVGEEIYDELTIIPCARQKRFVEWVRRNKDDGSGGGFVGVHLPDSAEVEAARKRSSSQYELLSEDGKHEFVETYYVYVLYQNKSGFWDKGVLPFTSTKIGKYKDFIGLALKQQIRVEGSDPIQLPLFAHRYVLGSERVEKDGNAWRNYTITFDGTTPEDARLSGPSDELFVMAQDFCTQVDEGEATADVSTSTEAGTESAKNTTDDEIPF